MRISDWSSDVCSSDLIVVVDDGVRDNGRDATFLHFEHIRSRRDLRDRLDRSRSARVVGRFLETRAEEQRGGEWKTDEQDDANDANKEVKRKEVREGKEVEERVRFGGCRRRTKKKTK